MSSNNIECPVMKTTCKDSEIIKEILGLITRLENTRTLSITPISKRDLEEIKNALGQYIIECEKCTSTIGNDYNCIQRAKVNLKRRIPFIRDMIYPWKNYEFDYGNYVRNNYSPSNTGATGEGSFNGIYKDVKAFIKLLDGFISDPIPNTKTQAGIDDVNRCEDNDMNCKMTQEIRNSYKQDAPTDDEFMKNRLEGEYSSSYYVRIGYCPRPDISERNNCESKGYTWLPEVKTCSQPRYAFIDNTPKAFFNGSNMRGMIPSIAEDINSMSPDKIYGGIMGYSVGNKFQIQSCPKI